MTQNTFKITVTDSKGNKLSPSRVYFLDANKAPIVSSGKPVFAEFFNGTNTMSSDQMNPLNVRVASTGYIDKVVALAPGDNVVVLDSAEQTKTTTQAKGLFFFVIVVVIIVLAYKFLKL